MKLTSVIKVLCSFALLLSTLGSYAGTSDHAHRHGAELRGSYGLDQAEVIMTAFSILEDAVMPDEASAGAGTVHLTRFSEFFVAACADHTGLAPGMSSGSSVYFCSGQHALALTSVPLFISIRRLLI
jgi:hypothetical protein